MDSFLNFLTMNTGDALAPIALLLVLLGAGGILAPAIVQRAGGKEARKRLVVENPVSAKSAKPEEKRKSSVGSKAVKKAQDFYAKTDPENVARLRLDLIRAGYMDPKVVGYFFVIRFAMLALFTGASFAYSQIFSPEATLANTIIFSLIAGGFGYFAPGLVLQQKIKSKRTEYRYGFPDFMDLMIVCSDAGMSMEASIDRVSREIALSYPSLSEHLHLVTIELRAGRNLDSALKSLSERLGLEEVRAFATLLQQSKELGTSLSGALRVFSDEMRHKRMSKAEEKAHALPAKMSVPVTVCILPVVLMIAVIPIIVKFSTQ
jgi:tight adherence protein C